MKSNILLTLFTFLLISANANSQVNCLAPINLNIISNTGNSVELDWTEQNSAVNWHIEYGPSGFTHGTGTVIYSFTNPFVVTGLFPNITYDFCVRSECSAGNFSSWTCTSNASSSCPTFQANGFLETFENNSSSLSCWQVKNENADNDMWTFSALNPNTGVFSANLTTNSNNGANDDYLISPQMNLTGIESMKFAYSVSNAALPNDFQILISTTGSNVSDFNDTLLPLAQYSNTNYQEMVVDLTAYSGLVYIAFHVPPGGLDGDVLFIDDVTFGECIPAPGQDGNLDACISYGTIDLNNGIISNINSHGTWEYPSNQTLIVDDSLFNIGMLPQGVYDVLYIVEGLCQADTTVATINVVGLSNAGSDGVVTVCKNEPIDLLSALTSSYDVGGTWYDFSNASLPTAMPIASSVPGQYVYTYIVSNGVCPSDTSEVTVTVDGSCNYLSIENAKLNDLKVSPNPANDVLTVINPSNERSLKVEIIDMNGRIVLVENQALNNATEAILTIDNLENGVYTLRIYNNEGQKTFKIVKH